jgi:hypothetical protein
VFTERCALSHCIKHKRFVFKGLISFNLHDPGNLVWTLLGLIALSIVWKPPTFQRHTRLHTQGKNLRRFRDTLRLHPQGKKPPTFQRHTRLHTQGKKPPTFQRHTPSPSSGEKTSDVSETHSISILRESDLFPWGWRRSVSLKRRRFLDNWHGYQPENSSYNFVAVKAWRHTKPCLANVLRIYHAAQNNTQEDNRRSINPHSEVYLKSRVFTIPS